MNTKILKQIQEKVRFSILDNDGVKEYVVEKMMDGEWKEISRSLRLEKALLMKHNAWHSELHMLSHTPRLLRRRKHGKRKFLGIQMN